MMVFAIIALETVFAKKDGLPVIVQLEDVLKIAVDMEHVM